MTASTRKRTTTLVQGTASRTRAGSRQPASKRGQPRAASPTAPSSSTSRASGKRSWPPAMPRHIRNAVAAATRPHLGNLREHKWGVLGERAQQRSKSLSSRGQGRPAGPPRRGRRALTPAALIPVPPHNDRSRQLCCRHRRPSSAFRALWSALLTPPALAAWRSCRCFARCLGSQARTDTWHIDTLAHPRNAGAASAPTRTTRPCPRREHSARGPRLLQSCSEAGVWEQLPPGPMDATPD
jgi:hypothetical protein